MTPSTEDIRKRAEARGLAQTGRGELGRRAI